MKSKTSNPLDNVIAPSAEAGTPNRERLLANPISAFCFHHFSFPSYSPDNHSDTFFCPPHLSAIQSELIPSASLGINAKGRVWGLEKISACSLGDGLPSQAPSKWVKVNQSSLVRVRRSLTPPAISMQHI